MEKAAETLTQLTRRGAFPAGHFLLLEAEIADKRGWVAFKNAALEGNLEIARKAIQDAVFKKPDPMYYFHLARVCEKAGREATDQKTKEINLRQADAYCDHALNMVPVKSLSEKLDKLKAEILKTLPQSTQRT